MISCPDILASFECVSLKEMDGVKLMNRTDAKYIFNIARLHSILESVKPYYKVLVVDDKKMSGYKTLYYDTNDHAIYTLHHNGKLNRYKIRHRTYTESNIGYLEVKFKNNKGRTIKERIRKKDVPKSWEGESLDFLSFKIPYAPETLLPALWVNYHRITLVSKISKERLTIDLGLEFVKNEKVSSFGKLVIAEVKQESKAPSEFIKAMKAHHIREGSISKYCLGIASINPDIKKNNFKEKLLHINQIIYATNIIADC